MMACTAKWQTVPVTRPLFMLAAKWSPEQRACRGVISFLNACERSDRAEAAGCRLSQSSLCWTAGWPLLRAASCARFRFAPSLFFSFLEEKKIYVLLHYYTRRRESKKGCGHGRGHMKAGSGDPDQRRARLCCWIGSTHLIGAEGCMAWHGMAFTMPMPCRADTHQTQTGMHTVVLLVYLW